MDRVDEPGQTVATHAGKPVAVFGWCEGSWICQKRVSESHLERVGEVLGTIHRVGEGYAGAPENRFSFAALRGRLKGLSGQELNEELQRACDLLGRRIDELTPRVEARAASTVVHGDVFRDNVLWTRPDPPNVTLSAVLDFESASLGDPAFDLMVTMLAWCYGDALERSLAQALLRGYRREREPSGDDLAACYDQARAAAVRFAVTRITDYELRPRGVVVYKDYRRFLGRLAAVEAIGAGGFVDWLTG
jgi:homoserine kinase type II